MKYHTNSGHLEIVELMEALEYLEAACHGSSLGLLDWKVGSTKMAPLQR